MVKMCLVLTQNKQKKELNHFELIGHGEGIYLIDLDED
jgi:hypothetical protein